MQNEMLGAPRRTAGPRRTWRRWSFVLVISMSILAMLLTSCTSSTSLTNSDNGKSIQVHVGDEIDIALNSSPDTGYEWAVEKSDAKLLTFKQSNFSASNSSPGSSGTQTLTFVAKSAGTVNLQLKYWRHFEGDKSITQQFSATIQIQA